MAEGGEGGPKQDRMRESLKNIERAGRMQFYTMLHSVDSLSEPPMHFDEAGRILDAQGAGGILDCVMPSGRNEKTGEPTYTVEDFMRAVRELRAEYPDIEIEVHRSDSRRILGYVASVPRSTVH